MGEPVTATGASMGRGMWAIAARKRDIAGGMSPAQCTATGRSAEGMSCEGNKGLPTRFLCFQRPGSTSSHSMA